MENNKNRLTDNEFENGNIWLKHTFFEVIHGNLGEAYSWNFTEMDFEVEKDKFVKLYTSIKDQLWDDIDDILHQLAAIKYSDKVLGTMSGGKLIQFTPEELARIVINMCYNCEIWWDNSSHTKQEKEYFEKTILGKAIKDLDCYLIPNAAPQAQTQTSAQNNPGTKAKRQSGQPNSWTSRGPLSSQVRGLVGQPHQKIFSNNTIYKIVDEGKSGKEVHAIVRTLNPKGDAGNNTNLVFVSNSNNYGDSLCLFDNTNELTDFLEKVQAAYVDPVTGNQLGKLTGKIAKKDPNGYFRVKTNCGECLILASGLNEALEEEVEEVKAVSPLKKLTAEELKDAMIYNAN